MWLRKDAFIFKIYVTQFSLFVGNCFVKKLKIKVWWPGNDILSIVGLGALLKFVMKLEGFCRQYNPFCIGFSKILQKDCKALIYTSKLKTSSFLREDALMWKSDFVVSKTTISWECIFTCSMSIGMYILERSVWISGIFCCLLKQVPGTSFYTGLHPFNLIALCLDRLYAGTKWFSIQIFLSGPSFVWFKDPQCTATLWCSAQQTVLITQLIAFSITAT